MKPVVDSECLNIQKVTLMTARSGPAETNNRRDKMSSAISKRFESAIPYAKIAAIILIYFTFIESNFIVTGIIS